MSTIMALAGPEDRMTVAVVGPKSGISQAVADRLMAEGGARNIVYLGDEILGLGSSGASVVILAGDAGEGSAPADDLVLRALPSLPSSLQYLLYVSPSEVEAAPAEDTSAGAKPSGGVAGLVSLFKGGPESPLTAVRQLTTGQSAAKVIVMHTGRLFGPAAGPDPVPFLTGPKAEPKLNECWARRAALVGVGTLLAQTRGAATKRATAAAAVAQYLRSGGVAPAARGAEFSVVSADGPPPSEEEWAEELARVGGDAAAGAAVLAIEFDAMPRRDALVQWLTESWGPATLRRVESNMIRSGARPVRAAALRAAPASAYAPGGGAEVIWEAPTRNLEVEVTGRLQPKAAAAQQQALIASRRSTQVLLRDEPGSAGMRVVRCDGAGAPQIVPLVGEDEIVQSLLEGINAVAYARGYVTRKTSAAAATAAAAKATAAATAAAAAVVPARAAEEEATAAAAVAAAQGVEGPAKPAAKGRGRRARR
ncbi:hypothetical protein JKP88DRAFT_349925 [Tribonema minus]|uniref:Uncharacterized protein n=1 Tax=Tribonema minus TaxID=303371 RepID=A0A835YZQ9_9STRA|nr:hypothetical protein JKP88DRAFT_349925 [Tribonema minus]